MANLLLCSAVQLGTSFVQTFEQFLAVRSLFGIAMGGVWGLASSTALENLPVEARGLASGVLQQGYAVGYLISAILNLFLVPRTHHGWRVLFWTTSCISAFAACIRALVPESEVFLRLKEEERVLGANTGKKTKIFIRRVGQMLRQHWGLCIYAVLLMAGAVFLSLVVRGRELMIGELGFNFLSHGSQDLYPTYLKTSKGFSVRDAIVATIIGNCGAITFVALTLHHPNYLFNTSQRWRHCRIRVTVHRPQAHDYPLCFLQRGVYSALDPSVQLQRTLSRRVLGPVWRAGRVGSHSHSTCRDEPSRIPCDVPRRRIPTRKCALRLSLCLLVPKLKNARRSR